MATGTSVGNYGQVPRSSSIRTLAREAADEVQRNLIIDATCDVIANEGLEAASLRRIAEKLECTTGLITHYFTSKDDLLVKALERVIEIITGGKSLALDHVVPLSQRLNAFYRTLPVEGDARRFWLVLMAFRAASVGNPRLADVYKRIGLESWATMRASVGAELGRAADDPKVVSVAAAINAVLEGFGDATAVNPGTFTPEMVTTHVETIVGALVQAAR